MSSTSRFGRGCQLGLSGLLIIVGAIALGGDPTFAQVTADPSLGTKVTPNGTTLEIRGGTTVGGKNLFHSFSNFSVKSEEVANFLNASTISNILVRVTGGNLSDIQGQLKAQGNANLFLINPNGILFGRDAKLDIGGSFIATTASAIQFPGGGEFSMTSPVDPLNPLLSVNPSAFLFNQIASTPISPIQVNKAFLSVPEGQSLLLLGGDVNLEGGRLVATGGRVELGGLAGAGTVGLNFDSNNDSNNLRLSFPSGVQRADVSLTNAAKVTASGIGGGGIQMQGRRIKLTNGSVIAVNTSEGSQPGGSLVVNASELVELLEGSRLLTETAGAGSAGNLEIETPQLIAKDGSQASATTFSEGQGGRLSVTATDSILLIGTSPQENPSGLFARTEGAGAAGDLEIKTGQLIVRDKARISASASGESTGRGGSITLKTGELNVLNDAQVIVSSAGLGDAGELRVKADSIKLDKGTLGGTTASGRGGDINLQVHNLIVMRNSSAIATTAKNNGTGGNIEINAPFIVAIPKENSDILANANQGSGGKIKINATGIYGLENRTKLTPSDTISEINASSNVQGLEGVVEINTPDIDPNTGLINLPRSIVEPKLASGCQAPTASHQSSFIITGRGGLPPNPSELLTSDAVQVDLVSLNSNTTNHSLPSNSKPTIATPAPIVEATGWVRNANGVVFLTANSPTVTPHNSWQTPAACSTNSRL